MKKRFEELDYQETPLGGICLQRRELSMLDGREVYEVKLGDEYLMSSLFHEAEVQLATLGLEVTLGAELDVVVGGLGLGYTAVAALDEPRVRSLLVIDALAAVIGWHQRGLVPLGPRLTQDARCRLVNGDFFTMASSAGEGFDPAVPNRLFDAVLLDIDHAPTNVLHPRNRAFYTEAGLAALALRLKPEGVFALWSNDPPDESFMAVMAKSFAETRAHVVEFANPLQNATSKNTVYVGRRR